MEASQQTTTKAETSKSVSDFSVTEGVVTIVGVLMVIAIVWYALKGKLRNWFMK
jgi:hypothetical protein